MPAFSITFVTFIAMLLEAAAYLAVLIGAIRRRAGQELTAALLAAFAFVALVLQIAEAVSINNPEVHVMVVLVDARPEEVTEAERTVKGEVIASTFDRPAEDHAMVAELAVERAKRLVELGQDVVLLLDSLTALGRAYAVSSASSARGTPQPPWPPGRSRARRRSRSSPCRRRRRSSGTRHRAQRPAASCGHRMRAQSRAAMRTAAWPKTATARDVVVKTMAGRLRLSLTSGSSWTLVRIPAER